MYVYVSLTLGVLKGSSKLNVLLLLLYTHTQIYTYIHIYIYIYIYPYIHIHKRQHCTKRIVQYCAKGARIIVLV